MIKAGHYFIKDKFIKIMYYDNTSRANFFYSLIYIRANIFNIICFPSLEIFFKYLYLIEIFILDQLRTNNEELTTKLQDSDVKLTAFQQNVLELRNQLEQSKLETNNINKTLQQYELEINKYRKERNDAFDARDETLQKCDRLNRQIERYKADIKTMETEHEQAVTEKCDAIRRLHDIEAKEYSLGFKEKLMEQDRVKLNNEIAILQNSLANVEAELKSVRQENSYSRLHLDNELEQKTEELNLLNGNLIQYRETNHELKGQVESLTTKLKEQSDDSTKLMDYYKNELQAVKNLADLYKQNNEDSVTHTNELNALIAELKKTINEITDQYGELETKLGGIEHKHNKDLKAKDDVIDQLKEELRNANDLIKVSNDEKMDNDLERLAPTAAAASRILRSGMTMTEIYTLYTKAKQDFLLKERECNQIDIQLKGILQELKEHAPANKKQAIEFEKMMAENIELNQQVNTMINELAAAREETAKINAKFNYFERENKQLKLSQSDLARQVRYLLNEIEQSRGGCSASDADLSIGSGICSNEIISRTLVTFGEISELQDNNQKLLLLVRDLSQKLEEAEELTNQMNQASYEAKINNYTRRLNDLEASREIQSQQMAACIRQKDRFKKLYYEIMKDVGKIPADSSFSGGEAMDDDDPDRRSVQLNGSNANASAEAVTAAIEAKDKTIGELEHKIKDTTKQLKQLREEYDEYRKEKMENDKLANEQYNSMRIEVRELTSTNCKLSNTVTYVEEQIKLHQKNAKMYKKQIETLEERIKQYERIVWKHELSLTTLREETVNSQRKVSEYERKCNEMQRHCHKLQENVGALMQERDSLYHERNTQNLLQKNLEMLKTSFERSQNEDRNRTEQRYDEIQKECSALRRRLQDEQDHFRTLSAELQRQTDTAVNKMNDEKNQANNLRSQVEKLRTENEAKSKQVDDLSLKLQESLTPCHSDNPIAMANKKLKSLQNQLDLATDQIDSLKKEIKLTNERAEEYNKMSANWEAETKELQENFDQCKGTFFFLIELLYLFFFFTLISFS